MIVPPPDLLSEMGYLCLGSRFKRLGERLQADGALILKSADFAFQPSQFNLLATLDRYGPLSVSQIVSLLGLSQPAITRSLAGLVKLGLAETVGNPTDRRMRMMQLTLKGADTFCRARTAIWPRLEQAVREMCLPLSGPLLDQLGQLESGLAKISLVDRFTGRRGMTPALAIVEYSDDLAMTFHDINAEWIAAMFTMEANDRDILENPRTRIIDRGGIILFVEAEGLGIVGTCALIKIDEGVFELTKMGVRETVRGLKAGEFLLAAILERARSMKPETLFLLTNSKCAAAVHLYEKLGFRHDAGIMTRYGARYGRCNVAMLFPF